jgi:integrase
MNTGRLPDWFVFAIAPIVPPESHSRVLLPRSVFRSARINPTTVDLLVLNELSVQYKGKTPDALVFAGRHGGYLQRPKSANGWLTWAVKAAGVQTITPHDLRHTCASLAVSAGVNVLALARMLGHKDPSVTLRVYADLFDTDLDAVAESLHVKYSREKCVQTVSTAGQNRSK